MLWLSSVCLFYTDDDSEDITRVGSDSKLKVESTDGLFKGAGKLID